MISAFDWLNLSSRQLWMAGSLALVLVSAYAQENDSVESNSQCEQESVNKDACSRTSDTESSKETEADEDYSAILPITANVDLPNNI